MTWSMARRCAAGVLAAGALVAVVGATAGPSDSDLLAVREDPAPAPPGGTTTVRGFVGNAGPDTTASPFTVLIDVPAGFTFEGPYFPANCRAAAGAHLLSCTFGPGLKPGRSATALAPVRVGTTVPPGTKAEGHVRVVSVDDRTNPENDSTPFTLTVS